MNRSTRWTLVLVACALLVLSVTPTLAQLAPKITVAPNWGPALQLTSLDTNGLPYPNWNSGDDYRYIDAWINVTTTVEFWAVEMSCTANGNVLDVYEWDDDATATPEDWGDDRPGVMWLDNAWNGPDGWTSFTSQYTNTAGQLKLSAVASKRGRNLPIGRNGVETMVSIAGLRFRARPTAGTSPLACTFSFLDRNGKVVVPATYTAPAPVAVISGFTVTGTVSYQARTVKNNIGVNCWIDGSLVPGSPFLTNASGAFTISNIRTWNHINCRVYGNITNPSPGEDPGDVYLVSQFNFNVGEHGSYRELPIELLAGNVQPEDCDPNPGWHSECINDNDLTTLTGAWGSNPAGDVNGDGKTDKSDLAIVAGNISRGEEVDASHVLYSLARNWLPTGRGSRVWRGDRQSGPVVEQVPGAANTADFWATLSRDGQTIAFIRKTAAAGQPAKYELFTAPAAGGAPKLLISKAAAGNMDAFAPSWSEDGMALAFICAPTSGTPGVPDSGYLYNAGNVCIIDSNGRNFHQITGGLYGPNNAARIYPPVWTWGSIFFAGTSNAAPNGCANTLCMYDWNTFRRLDNDVPAPPAGTADMPSFVNGWLFYRFTDPGGNQSLRFIENLDFDCHAPSGQPCNWDYVKAYNNPVGRACPSDTNPRPPFAHSSVVFDSNDGAGCTYELLDWNAYLGAPYVVGNYELSPYGFEIMLSYDASTRFRNTGYRWDLGLEDTNPGFGCADGTTGTADSDRCWPEWGPLMYIPPDMWWVDEHEIGSHITDDAWNGDPATPTLLHVERATMDWTP